MHVFQLGDCDKAAEQFEQATRIDPRCSTAHHTFGPVQFASGNADQALDEFHAAPKLEPHRYNTHFNLSKLHDRKGRYNEARRHLEIMFALRPDDLAARRDLDELRELDQSFLSTNS